MIGYNFNFYKSKSIVKLNHYNNLIRTAQKLVFLANILYFNIGCYRKNHCNVVLAYISERWRTIVELITEWD